MIGPEEIEALVRALRPTSPAERAKMEAWARALPADQLALNLLRVDVLDALAVAVKRLRDGHTMTEREGFTAVSKAALSAVATYLTDRIEMLDKEGDALLRELGIADEDGPQ